MLNDENLEGSYEMKMLNKLQTNQRKRSLTRILKAIESNELVTYSKLLKKSIVSDKKTLRTHLKYLVDSKILGAKTLTCIPCFRNGLYYYKEPAQNHIRDLIDEEDAFKHFKNYKKYYFGTYKEISLYLQFIHKKRIIELQIRKKQHKKSSGGKNHNQLFWSMIFFQNDEDDILSISEIQKHFKKNDQEFQKIALEELDKFAMKHGLKAYLLSNHLSNLEKFYIIALLPNITINHLAKKFHCSTAPIKKIKKFFFDYDDHVNEEKVTTLHDTVFGEKLYLIRNRKSLLDSNGKLQLPKFRTRKEQFLHSITPETEYVSYGQYFNWLKNQK